MFFFITLTSSQLTLTVKEFKETMFTNINGADKTIYNVELSQYGTNADNFIYVTREPYEKDANASCTNITIQDTPENINNFTREFSVVTEYNYDLKFEEGKTIVYLKTEKAASYRQMGTFWVTLISVFLLVAFCIASLLIWHFDRYDLDPANALLFVTEAHKDSSLLTER